MVTQFTGLHVKRVLAMLDTYPRDVNVLMDFGGSVTGTLWASQIAIGHECNSGIYVIGTEGSLEWTATDTFPTVEDGVLGVRFVEACVRSHTAGGVWMDV